VQPVTRVKLDWEVAYGSGYTIQTSTNGSSWTNAYTEYAGDGGTDDLKVTANARYVRLNGTTRATGYGYSLWEFQVYGACPGGGPTGGPTTSPPTTPPPGSTTWAPNTAYAVGQQVTYAGVSYKCLQAHTSIVTWEPPNTPALWQRL
jgi:hypothetical protein